MWDTLLGEINSSYNVVAAVVGDGGVETIPPDHGVEMEKREENRNKTFAVQF